MITPQELEQFQDAAMRFLARNDSEFVAVDAAKMVATHAIKYALPIFGKAIARRQAAKKADDFLRDEAQRSVFQLHCIAPFLEHPTHEFAPYREIVGDDRVYAELQFAARMGFPVTPELAAIYIQQLMALDIEEGEGHLWDTSPFGLAQNPTHLLPLGLQVAEPQPTTAPAQQPTPHAEVVEEDVVAETQPKSKPVLWANATLQNALTGASELLKK